MASSYRLRGASTSSSAQWKYDVFLSFRGEDTRKKFTDHLYDKLQWRGIKTFRDDPDLERGTCISPELLAAIEHSNIAVIVLSPNYASSKWCLLELAKIVRCMGKRGTILPVFYEVEPSDVRHQTGSFASAFAEHEEEFGEDSNKVQEWRDALTQVANLAGWTSQNWYEADLIKEIVDTLWKEVQPTFATSEKLVGMDSKLMEIECLLSTEATDCFIGIWGMGGIGKTTLATQVLHRISPQFEVGIFLPNVRQVSAAQGLVHLQEQLLCQILKEKNIQVQNVDDGVAKLKRCLFNKKVILVLDDVDRLDQLENLAGGNDWFGSGSIIIVTTRNQHLLGSHGIRKQYKSKGLNKEEALQYFSWRAFKKEKPEEGYMELSKTILEYAGGLPLAIKILGSLLLKRDRGDWESTLAMLKKAPIDHDIFEVLRVSYDGLDEMCQQVFLDIVCFLKGIDKERVIQILNSVFDCDIGIKINVLIEKSLLSVYDNCVHMHDLIQEMGEEIVRMESKKKPWKRSRLWLRDDIFHVLKENVGTGTIRSVALCLPELEELAWNPKALSKMSELKFLKMKNLVLCQGPDSLPDAITVLEWSSFPSKSLPPNFCPVHLVELSLHHSKIEQLWDGKKVMEKLTHIDLSYSENLVSTPDFTGTPSLERLVLEGCTNLVDIHPSIKSLKRLKVLNLKNCPSIENLPGELEMDSLEMIEFSGIFPLFVRNQEFSESSACGTVEQKVSWTQLFFQMISVVSLVFASLKHFCFKRFQVNDRKLLGDPDLSCCEISMQDLEVSCDSVGPHHPLSPVLASLKHFCYLKRLHLSGCRLDEISDDIGCLSSLEDLDLSGNDFFSLPESISRLSKLKSLNLANCKRLRQLPRLPSFSGTCDVTVDNCISLQEFPDPPEMCRLWKLSFNFINCCRVSRCAAIVGTLGYRDVTSLVNGKAHFGKPEAHYLKCPAATPASVEDDSEDGTVEEFGVEIVDDGRTSHLIKSMLQRFLLEPPPFFESFSTVVPGKKIPGWFKNRSAGVSARHALPDCSSCRRKWIGFALCVLIGAEENPGALGEDRAKTISCSWKPGLFVPANFIFHLNQVVESDHICIFLLPSKHYPEHAYLTDPKFIDFFFGADAGLKVKKCGVRTLYKQKLKELQLRMNRLSRSIPTMLRDPSPFYEMFSRVIPGNGIPVWFTTRGEGDLVSQERPCISCCSWWMGFVLCVLFEAQEITGEILKDDLSGVNRIWCYWKAKHFSSARYSCAVVDPSDHLCVFFIPGDKFLHLPNQVDFEFKSDACSTVKQYGVCSLYEHDLPNLNSLSMGNSTFAEQLLRSISNC